ncbi:polysaccharide deacetylase family protein [Metabacillus halosaccharovorans]|uniref:Polysaccharide deacetylase family protein n=1 Tax=Metabacillus halosaccharovorans TaxID=930124 RepID=A0ABT3DBS8_9BACI|nr:polysaccharide deacetylase family protein [Metabacillus halosaccharovorans]MCV9884508.1 polysaccharide deacetylase family protein [Metabacillus halosaccharovorans]
MSSNQSIFNYKLKNRNKYVKVIFQLAVLVLLVGIIIRAVFITDEYKPLSAKEMVNSDGFIALSYFGVDRSGSAKYISKEELEKQLSVLKKQGFETISQKQIIDFYQQGTPLPEKALFLSFEDGRNDSSIFSQKALETLNYKATMFTYADKMDTKDTKFLKPNHLQEMIESGFWELGSNGYRLTYINIFNGDGEYLGEIEENNVPDKTSIEYYNHYLMDYLRDEYMIPKETRTEMEERITKDYQFMHAIYEDRFSSMPKAYAIMHANSLYNNMHPAVEAANNKMIKEYFSLHFNRDVYAYNSSTENIYNLNRLQVAPNWPVNHLLMKIQHDSKWTIDFENGDKKIADNWKISNGVGEFDQHKIILTTEPGKEVIATLTEKLPSKFTASFDLKGNVMGAQSFTIQSSDSQNQLKMMLEKNVLNVYKVADQKDESELLFKQKLDEINWSGADYAFNKATQYDFMTTQQGSRIDEDEYPSTLKNDRHIVLSLADNKLKIKVDNKRIAEVEMPFSSSSYQLLLGGSMITKQNSHEQDTDSIYDSIIENVIIQSQDKTLYTVDESKSESFLRSVSQTSSDIIDFFIESF